MPLPALGDVHVNVPLTNMSVAYVQDAKNFICDRVFPVLPVTKQANRYNVYSKADFNRDEAQRRAPGTESAGGGWRIDNTPTYYCDVWALHKDVDDQTRSNQDEPINLDRDATIYVTQQLLIRRDKQWVSRYFVTGVWGNTDQTGVAAAPGANQFLQWNQAASTPVSDVTAQSIVVAEQTGFKPNKWVIGARVYDIVRNHSQVLDRIKYTQRGVVTPEILASVFDVDDVLVGWATNNTAKEAQTATMSFILGKAALLVYATPTPSIMMPSGGYTFTWSGLFGAGEQGNRIKRFRMEWLESDRVEGEMAFDCKLVASDCGTFFATAVA